MEASCSVGVSLNWIAPVSFLYMASTMGLGAPLVQSATLESLSIPPPDMGVCAWEKGALVTGFCSGSGVGCGSGTSMTTSGSVSFVFGLVMTFGG